MRKKNYRIGEYKESIPFSNLVGKLEERMEEKVKSWRNQDKPVKRIAILTVQETIQI